MNLQYYVVNLCIISPRNQVLYTVFVLLLKHNILIFLKILDQFRNFFLLHGNIKFHLKYCYLHYSTPATPNGSPLSFVYHLIIPSVPAICICNNSPLVLST